MLSYFDLKALHLLREEVTCHPSPQQVAHLADDLQAISDELNFDCDDEANAAHAASVLRQRIGGWANLKSYQACLDVHTTKDSRKADIY